MDTHNIKRVAIKIGSNVLSNDEGSINRHHIYEIVREIAKIRESGIEVIVISSGAVACGRDTIKEHAVRKLDSVQQRQLYSAVGQITLMNLYSRFFNDYDLQVGQVLTTKENFKTRSLYLNQKSCISTMLENGIIPIVNENDTVSITELMFTDNDELSGLIATMMDVQLLLILSNIDGIYNGDPKKTGSTVIRSVEPGEDLTKYISSGKSDFGRGGMVTKYNIAAKVAKEGITVVIANGKKDASIITGILFTPDQYIFTRFIPQHHALSGVKKWIAHSNGFTKGSIYINANTVKAITGNKATSILPVGVTRIEGDFEKDDLVMVLSEDGENLGMGRSAYSSVKAAQIAGKHGCRPIIHYDYLFLY